RLGSLRFRHGQHIVAVAYSPDGRTIASAGRDGRVVLHDLATGKKLRSFGGETPYASSVAFAPDGKTLAAGGGRPQVGGRGLAARRWTCGRWRRGKESAGSRPPRGRLTTWPTASTAGRWSAAPAVWYTFGTCRPEGRLAESHRRPTSLP